ncbi:hypothetical protein NY78_1230 [Desulfovibrio sp. TomC]|nr:hypothetical protein NY78_1230 [Desulfovibrio sp. TomC]
MYRLQIFYLIYKKNTSAYLLYKQIKIMGMETLLSIRNF